MSQQIWLKGDIGRKFYKESIFENFFVPLLSGLGWIGTRRQIIEALPVLPQHLTPITFKDVMLRLDFECTTFDCAIADIELEFMPFVFYAEKTQSFHLISKEEDGQYFEVINDEFQPINAKLTGEAFIFKKNENNKKWYTDFIRGKFLLFCLFSLLSLLSSLTALVIPMYVMNVYDKVVPTRSVLILAQFTFAAGTVLLCQYIINYVRCLMLVNIALQFFKTMMGSLYNKLLHLRYHYIENVGLGANLSRLDTYLDTKDILIMPTLMTILDLPFIFVYLFVIWLIDRDVFLIPMIALIIYGIMVCVMMFWLGRSNVFMNFYKNKDRQALIIETLSILDNLKRSSLELSFKKKFRETLSSSILINKDLNNLATTLSSVTEGLMAVTVLLTITVGAVKVIEESISAGSLIAIMMIAWRMVAPLSVTFAMIPQLRIFFSTVSQISSLVNLSEKEAMNNNVKLESVQQFKLNGRIDIARLTYRYPTGAKPALFDFTLSIEPKEMICICGTNSSGKSTVLKLIHGFYQPLFGMILYDNLNNTQIHQQQFKASISYLPQKPELVDGSILDNFYYSFPMAKMSEILEISKALGLHYDVEKLPDKYNTIICKNSINLVNSSFIQKIALCKVFMKKTSIYLLDNPAGFLNAEDEKRFVAMLMKVRKTSTIIYVTHRPSLMRMADRAAYISDGHLKAVDTPNNILSQVGMENF